MRGRLRFLALASVGAVVLAASSSALGDETAYQIATPNWSACQGFAIESVTAVISSCVHTPNTVGISDGSYSAAANGSIVYAGNYGEGPIWLSSPGSAPVELDSSADDTSPSISYDGSKVVFARTDPVTGASDIYSVNSDGSDLQDVISGGGVNLLRVPAISPDGSSIAYWCGPAVNGDTTATSCGPLTDGSYRYAGVMRANIDGSNQRMIVIGPGGNLEPVGPSSLSWSPDSQWIAMDGLLPTADFHRDLFEYRTDGSDLFNNLDPTRQITDMSLPNIPIYAQFSPDGSQLLYMDFVDGSGDQGNFSYLIGVDGSDPHEIYLNPNVTCTNGSCYGSSYGAFIPTATPTSPPPLVDMTHITVPSVTDLTQSAAASTLSSVNLTVGTVSQSYSDTVAEGAIVSQSPVAGAVAHRTVKTGPPVNLVVSAGPPPATMSLNVSRSGAGSGTVSSNPSGISCGAMCSYGFTTGASVTLAATPAAGSMFSGWSGACSGTGACTVTMSQAVSVTASFALVPETLTVTKAGGGSGVVASTTPGISCGSTCSHAFDYRTSVMLTATPSAGSRFVGWSGACSGTGVCNVTMSAARSVKASFALGKTLKVTKAGNGTGTVVSKTPGISCGSTCSYTFAPGAKLVLTAKATTGSKFAGWSGACTGLGVCKVTMSASRSVKATFKKLAAAPRTR
jgi:Divergent InlB B-repeat domain/PASTA domain/WD40-like Beta Propeller Repeat